MTTPLVYHIYSHADADGGIAAAIFARFITEKYGDFGWKIEINPVNHGPGQAEWALKEIQWPCAILDFTLHPHLLSDRFFIKKQQLAEKLGDSQKIPPCYWIDHHPTGSSYPFLTAENAQQMLPEVVTKWDVRAISTPGLLRTHHAEIGLPRSLLELYEEYTDQAEIIDGALYATAEAAHDFFSSTIKLQTLFSSSHAIVDRNALYKKLVQFIMKNPVLEDLFDSDPLYEAIIKYEHAQHASQMAAYIPVTQKRGNVAIANFFHAPAHLYEGLGRFLPYLLFPEVEYAIHVMPKNKGLAGVSCGINPWNKPMGKDKHLGNFFARHFGGGGHAFVAGGKVSEDDFPLIEKLIAFIQDETGTQPVTWPVQ